MDQITEQPEFAPAQLNDAVRRAEAIALTLPQVDLGTQHLVHGGMYARTIFIPAGTFLTGALTSADNICVMSGGITVTTDNGPVQFDGFHVLPATAGYKRAGWAHADTWWTTIWPTSHTDLAEIEESLTPEAERLQTRTLALAQVVTERIEGEH